MHVAVKKVASLGDISRCWAEIVPLINVAPKCHHFMSPFGRHLRGSRPSLKVSRNALFQTLFSWLSTHWLTTCLWQHARPTTSTACLLSGTPNSLPEHRVARFSDSDARSVSHEKYTPDCYATLNIALSGDHSATNDCLKLSPQRSPLGSNWRHPHLVKRAPGFTVTQFTVFSGIWVGTLSDHGSSLKFHSGFL